MKTLRFALASLALATGLCAMADWNFRNHRYDSFQATPTEAGQIMFAGNSITNMHSWFEAFGSHQEVVGRGNSGGFAYEMLDYLECYIDSKPEKLLVMIGTNDVSSGQSAEITAKRIMAIVKRTRVESPETHVYIESILPRSNNAKPDYEACNTLVREAIEAMADPMVEFVNLSEAMAPLGQGNGTWSHDGLHPRPTGYATWCHQVQDIVGYPTVYPTSIPSQESCGLGGSPAARVEQFPYFPVESDDILFFGDEPVHGAEWHELLRSANVKDRGAYWGWAGMNLTQARNVVRSALKDQAQKPAKIFLFYGLGEKDKTKYTQVVEEAQKQAPESEIYLVSMPPCTDTNGNNNNISFNTTLQEIAREKGCTYVDIFTPLSEDMGRNIVSGVYMTGRGYVIMANVLAQHIGEGVNPVSLEESEAVYNRRATRKIIGDALTTFYVNTEFGSAPGQIKEQYRAEIEEFLPEFTELLNSENLTAADANAAVSEFNALVAEARADMNMPLMSNETETHWYTLRSQRGSRYLKAAGEGVYGNSSKPVETSYGDNVWKFMDRGDETFDIVNEDGQYVSPTAGHNTQLTISTTAPEKGWKLSYSNQPTSYVIYSGTTCQLNQTGNAEGDDYKVFNWYGSSCPNRDDEGCAYVIEEFNGRFVEPPVSLDGWYTVALTGYVGSRNDLQTPTQTAIDDETNWLLASETEYEQNLNGSHNFYHVQIAAADAEKPARGFFHASQNSATRVYLMSPSGHYVLSNGCSTRRETSISVSETNGHEFTLPLCIWANNNIGAPTCMLGKFSGNSSKFTFAEADLTGLNAYELEIVGANNASYVRDDVKVSLDIPENRGLAAVYNGGYFFVTAGTAVTPEMVSAPEHKGVSTPSITVADNKITVDYDNPESAIDEIAAPAASEAVYDLQGRRVVNPRSGNIYLTPSRKFRL